MIKYINSTLTGNTIKRILKFILRMFWIFPVENKNILFISYGGLQYSCNPKYISEYLNKNHKTDYRIIWVFKDIKDFSVLEEKGIKLVRYRTLYYFKMILTSKVIITNNSIDSYLPIRDTQKIINTWHGGGAYKKVVSDKDIKALKNIRNTAKLFDLFVSTCELNSSLMIKDTFEHKGKILEIGFPRNDIFFKDDKKIKSKVYKYFNIDMNKKIILYAPTFRDKNNKDLYNIDVRGVLEAINLKFDGDWVLMVRGHHAIRKNLNFNEEETIDATQYEDMQELLYVSDLLITDYSSCIWDFALTRKPIIIFAEDLDLYTKERDFYVPIEEWYYPVARTNKELIKYISEINLTNNMILIEKHLQKFGSFEDGNATKKIVNEIKELTRN